MIKEKSEKSHSENIELFVWKSSEGRLGFDTDQRGIEFVTNFLQGVGTVLFPTFQKIVSSEDIESSINDFRGVSFFNNNNGIEKELAAYEDYLKVTKKNTILKRLGKHVAEISEPRISRFKIDGRYTDSFWNFIEEKRMNFVIWDWSDFGIYFYCFADLFPVMDAYVKSIAENLEITYCIVNSINDMPYN